MLKAVSLLFPLNPDTGTSTQPFQSPSKTAALKSTLLSPSSATFDAMQNARSTANGVLDEEALLKRPEVIEFINSFNASIQDKVDITSPSPRKIRLSLGYQNKPMNHYNSAAKVSPIRNNNLFSVKKTLYANNQDPDFPVNFDEIPIFPATGVKAGRESILITAEVNSALEAANNLDETEQLVERMIDVS